MLSGRSHSKSIRHRLGNSKRQRKLRLEALEQRNLLATFTWDGGGGANTAWMTGVNWVGDVAPSGNGDDLVFTGTAGTTSVNNFPAASFKSLTFNGPNSFLISGNAMVLTDGISSTAGNNLLDTQLFINTAPSINVAAGSLTISGVVTGSGTITKSGAGALNFARDIALSDVNVLGGTLSLGDAPTATGIYSITKVGPSGPIGGAVPTNLARANSGATAFANSLICCYPQHTIGGLNDGVYGNSNSWIGVGANALAGVDLPGATVYSVNSIAFGRDNAPFYTDRSNGTYTVYRTLAANPSHTNPIGSDPATGWVAIGTINVSSDAVRKIYALTLDGKPITTTGIMLATPDGAAIDELEIYGSAVSGSTGPNINVSASATVNTPQSSASLGNINVTGAGTTLTLNGRSVAGAGTYAINQTGSGPTGTTVPTTNGTLPNIALASVGAAPFADSVICCYPIHTIGGLNDGLYSNNNSWIGGAVSAKAGIDLPGTTAYNVSSIAIGRDNSPFYADRSNGNYTYYRTLVPNANHTLPIGSDPNTSWVAMGTITVSGNAIRKTYDISQNGQPVAMTGLMIKTDSIDAANIIAIDEIEIYGTAAAPGPINLPSTSINVSANSTIDFGLANANHVFGGLNVSAAAAPGTTLNLQNGANVTFSGISATGVASSIAMITATTPVINIAGGGTVNVAPGVTLNLNAVIGGSSALTKAGAGTLVLANANTYTGATTIQDGILRTGGSHQAYQITTNTTSNQAWTGSLGYDFTVAAGKSITVTQLGFYDAGLNGLATSHSVYISSQGGATILASATVPSGTAAPLVAGYRFVNLVTPVTLGPGNYTVWGDAYNVDPNFNSGGGVPAGPTDAGSNSELTFIGNSSYGSGPNVYPANPDGGPAYRYGAASFNFNTQVLPIGTAVNISGATAALDLNGTMQTIGSLTGVANSSVTLGSGNLTVNGSSSTSYPGTISGAGGLTKKGTGTLTLSGPNTYDGATNILAGTLVAASNAALGSTNSGTNVTSGATLGFSGNIAIGSEAITAAGAGVGGLGALRNLAGTNSVAGSVTMLPTSASGSATAASLVGGTAAATFSQTNFSPAQMVDGATNASAGGWANAGNSGGSTAVFETASNLNPSGAATELSFSILSGGYTRHTIGKFKLYATTDARANFASGVINNGQIGINWVELPVTAATAVNGTTLTINADGSVSASGTSPETDTFTIKTITSLANITGVRIDTIKDGALPASGPGRASNGNYVIIEWGIATATADISNVTIGSDAGDLALNGVISNSAANGTLTKNGLGSITFGGSSSNTFSGTTILDNGTLHLNKTGGAVAIAGPVQMGGGNNNQPNLRMLQANQFAPGVVMSGVAAQTLHARFDLQGFNQTLAGIVSPNSFLVVQNERLGGAGTTQNATLTLDGGGAYVFNGFFRDEDDGGHVYKLNLVKAGAGTQTLAGGSVNHQGTTTVSGGTLIVSNTTAWSSSIANSATVELGSTLANYNLGSGLTLSGSGTYRKTGTGQISLLQSIITASGNFQIQQGTLRNDGNSVNWNGSTANMDVSAGAVLDIRADSVRVNSLTGAGSIINSYGAGGGGTDTLTIGVLGGDSLFTGTIAGSGSGQFGEGLGKTALNKTGAGTLTLTNANTYSGGTTVSQGTLLVNNATGSATGSGDVTVSNGATLAGNGAISGNVNVSGILSPGMTVGAVSTLAIGGTLTLASGSTYQADVTGGADDLVTANNIVINSGANLAPSITVGLAAGNENIVLDAVASATGQFANGVANAVFPADRLLTVNGTEVYHLTNGDPGNRFASVDPTEVALVSNSPYTLDTTTSFNTNEDVVLSYDLVTSDPDQDLIVTITAQPGVGRGAVMVNPATGVVTYTPALDFSGLATFKYTVTENGVVSPETTVNISVTPVADLPSLTVNGQLNPTAAINFTINENASIALPIVAALTDTSAIEQVETLLVTISGFLPDVVLNVPGVGTFSNNTSYSFSGADIAALSGATISKPDNQPLDAPFTLTITATAIESALPSSTASRTATVNVTVKNTPPAPQQVEILVANVSTTPDTGNQITVTPGTPITFRVQASDLVGNNQDAPYRFTLTWKAGVTQTTDVNSLAGVVEFTYDYAGLNAPLSFTPTLTVQELDTGNLVNGDSASATISLTKINLSNIALVGDTLFVGGTSGSDRIVIQPSSGGVSVRYNNALSKTFSVGEKIVVYGNAGNDTITVSNLNMPVEFYGGAGNDYLAGGSQSDILDGGIGDDRLLAGAGNDTLYGGPGNDTLGGGLGSDIVFGDSYLDVNGNVITPTLISQHGRDALSGEAGDDFLYGEGNNDTVNGGLGSDLLRGGDGNDTLSGDDGHDMLSGDLGADKLYGRAGNDVLMGGAGIDILYGGTGDDLMFGNSLVDDDDMALEAIYLDWFAGDQATAVSDLKIAGRAAETAVDSLYGEGGADWYLLYFGDKVSTPTDKAPANTIETIMPSA